MRRRAQIITRAALLGVVVAAGVLALAWTLAGCTLVFVRGNDIALEHIGEHTGWQTLPATRDTPSVRERLFGHDTSRDDAPAAGVSRP
ncbi:hypothetical protein [Paraburkholderia terrae]|uniref:Uncharacterized protein n=1 Tax=Paraburkholderia terrae TaxID=311230 RepID=A0A2I8EU01_9BURK|nr:hypothetical protein [Paraburkholderia terrae]AUT62872.1 hypothetical protein C2L65_25190 [Paraburkholderia terrae]